MNYSAHIPIPIPIPVDLPISVFPDNQSKTNDHFNGCHNSNSPTTTTATVIENQNSNAPSLQEQVISTDTNKTSLSMTFMALQKHLNTTVKTLNAEDKENAPVNAQLCTSDDDDQWSVSITGGRVEAVEAVKREVTKLLSPGLRIVEVGDGDGGEFEEDEFENISLFEGDEDTAIPSTIQSTTHHHPSHQPPFTFKSLVHKNLLLGPKHHLALKLLQEHNCTLSFPSSHELILSTSSALPLLEARHALLTQSSSPSLPHCHVLISADKFDWLWMTGRMQSLEESLWRYGGCLQETSNNFYKLTALSPALLSKCSDALQAHLTAHQTLHLLLACRDDLRDYSASQLQGALQQAALSLNCTINHIPLPSHSQMHIRVSGADVDIQRFCLRLQSLPQQGENVRVMERRLEVQVPAGIREFVSGKKEGKLMRIMKETGVIIEVVGDLGDLGSGDGRDIANIVHDYDSLFIILKESVHSSQSTHPSQSSSAIAHAAHLLKGELPAHLTFHVPELHHKRMIGHGGKAIQRIMKKWGVYVKFMNSFESSQQYNLSDPFDSACSTTSTITDNVIVKTPGKNAAALEAIKAEIFALHDNGDGPALASLQRAPVSRVSIPNVQLEAVKKLIERFDQSSGVEFSLQERVLWIETTAGSESLKSVINAYTALTQHDRVISRSPTLSAGTSAEEAFKHFPSAVFVQSHRSLSASGSPLLSEERWLDSVEGKYESVEGQHESVDGMYNQYDSVHTQLPHYTQHPQVSPVPSSTSSVAMNSLSLGTSPSLLPVGSKESLGCCLSASSDDEVDGMIASIAMKRQFWMK